MHLSFLTWISSHKQNLDNKTRITTGLFVSVSSTNQNCPLYWTAYGNVCYRFRWVNLKSWVEAKTWCAAQGGDLLKLENAAEKVSTPISSTPVL